MTIKCEVDITFRTGKVETKIIEMPDKDDEFINVYLDEEAEYPIDTIDVNDIDNFLITLEVMNDFEIESYVPVYILITRKSDKSYVYREYCHDKDFAKKLNIEYREPRN